MPQAENQPSHPLTDAGEDRKRTVLSDPETWVDRHGNYLYRVAFVRVHNAELAEDMVQETFLSALKARDTFRGESSERTWLVGIMKRKIIDHYRKSNRMIAFSQQGKGDSDADPDFHEDGPLKGSWKWAAAPAHWGRNPYHALENADFRHTLVACLRRLPAPLADVFTFREVEGWRTEEICKEFEISTSNLWVMLHRARKQIRKCLEINWFRNQTAERSR